ncbi:hypothetical protein ABEF95_000616 [Exophiala dermatitidis]
MASPLTTRRVVTGHTPDGRSIIESDRILTSLNPIDQKPAEGIIPGITQILKTEGFPAKVNGPFFDPYGARVPLVDDSGVFVRIIHFPPIGEDQEDKLNFKHRTQSVDLGLVLSGEIQMTLDDDVKTILKAGDTVVQRGTVHEWRNISNEYCVMLFVLVPSEPIKVPQTGEVLEPTPMPLLED